MTKFKINYKVSRLFEMYSVYSEDPLVQVICIPYNVNTNEIFTAAVGGNHVEKFAKELAWKEHIDRKMITDKDPMKKLIVKHAEEDTIECLKGFHRPFKMSDVAVICSLQPCMSCFRALMNAGIKKIYWVNDNRHQDEQVIIRDFLNLLKNKDEIDYRKVSPDTELTLASP